MKIFPYANFTILHIHVTQLLEFPPKQILFPILNSQIQENKIRIISSIQNLGLWNNFQTINRISSFPNVLLFLNIKVTSCIQPNPQHTVEEFSKFSNLTQGTTTNIIHKERKHIIFKSSKEMCLTS
jgi:hypothetical protein